MSKFAFVGGKELEAAIAQLGKVATARNIGRRALTKAGQPIADLASELAPKDEGDLGTAIKVGKAVRPFQKDGNKETEVSVFVGIDQNVDRRLFIYAGEQEHGNPDRGMKAQPFMAPAWDAEKGKTVDRIAPLLWEEIAKAAARAARKRARGG